jgi:hypoxanthine-guanine phosphoribosyltransferase
VCGRKIWQRFANDLAVVPDNINTNAQNFGAGTIAQTMLTNGDLRDEIVRLEAQIDELTDRIESCRKFILAGWIAVAAGAVVFIAILVGAIHFDLSVMAIAIAAVLVGIVVAGSNRSTAQEATGELTAAEARRTALIDQIDLRLVPDRDGRR